MRLPSQSRMCMPLYAFVSHYHVFAPFTHNLTSGFPFFFFPLFPGNCLAAGGPAGRD
ncbi:hypothetical protein F751_0262 [Auxenochlorella protothecoides]|uniref:Uncharacterized protein n=1 Tax=Auxenochlorella protothecoides TaxID=3075 RepID=A0A087SNS1_AUXPR|nr:hypothetical protein F751_0262 [Auxenochlorella protothecoides]KFM27375.1 hypothetical protein F751_0262 [Auxenochlorella protothecoides]